MIIQSITYDTMRKRWIIVDDETMRRAEKYGTETGYKWTEPQGYKLVYQYAKRAFNKKETINMYRSAYKVYEATQSHEVQLNLFA